MEIKAPLPSLEQLRENAAECIRSAEAARTSQHKSFFTGSQPDGTACPADKDMTCKNWTSSTQGTAMLDHSDRRGLRDDEASHSWNSSHPSRGPDGGCSEADLPTTGGAGLFYCFAVN
jgi:hypothetical protein